MDVRKLLKYLSFLIVLTSMILAPLSAGPVQARTNADDAAEAAIKLSELESKGRATGLYRRLHPDAKEIIPESTVVGWYENDFFPLDPQPISEIVSVMFVDWTWGVTDQVYMHTAEVTFVQPFGVGSNATFQEETVRLVEEDGEWYWFFGRSREFVDEQIARFPEDAHLRSSGTGSPIGTGSASQGTASGQYTIVVFCSQVDAVVSSVVYAYCDWPFGFSAPFYCVPAVANSGSVSGTFFCNTSFTRDFYNPDEVVLDYAPKRIYTVEVTCEIIRENGAKYELCNWPMVGPRNPECIVNESRFTMTYEKFLLCKP